MSIYNGRIAIVGVAESEYGRVPSMTEMELHAQATWLALAESGLHKNDIDAVFCSSHTQGMPTVMLCEYLQIFPRYSDSTYRPLRFWGYDVSLRFPNKATNHWTTTIFSGILAYKQACCVLSY